MAHRALILSATYLVADIACALSVNGAILFGSGSGARLWALVSTVQVF